VPSMPSMSRWGSVSYIIVFNAVMVGLAETSSVCVHLVCALNASYVKVGLCSRPGGQ
jgi:hypothetical protein